jgi:hypothetical protein
MLEMCRYQISTDLWIRSRQTAENMSPVSILSTWAARILCSIFLVAARKWLLAGLTVKRPIYGPWDVSFMRYSHSGRFKVICFISQSADQTSHLDIGLVEVVTQVLNLLIFPTSFLCLRCKSVRSWKACWTRMWVLCLYEYSNRSDHLLLQPRFRASAGALLAHPFIMEHLQSPATFDQWVA